MKRIFLDTNFIIDLLIRDNYKSVSRQLLISGRKQKMRFFISFLTVANFAYIMRRIPKEELYQYLQQLIDIFEILPNNIEQIQESIELQPKDFEDAIQYQTAVQGKCDVIITRNEKDFAFSKIPVLNAEDFISTYL